MTTLLNEPRIGGGNQTQRPRGAMQTQRQESQSVVNVGQNERNVSMAAGAILTLQGLSRGSLVGWATAAVGGFLVYRGATGHCAMYEAMQIDTQHTQGKQRRDEIQEKGVRIEQSLLIQKSAEELYGFWRDFQNLPRIMTNVISITNNGDKRTHWVVKAPKIVGGQVEWDAEITSDEPNRLIRWRSIDCSQVDQVGEIRFNKALGDRGTEVHVKLHYVPPAGQLGHIIATLFDDHPGTKIRDDLRNFKRLMECGEILTTIGQPRGSCTGTGQGKVQETL